MAPVTLPHHHYFPITASRQAVRLTAYGPADIRLRSQGTTGGALLLKLTAYEAAKLAEQLMTAVEIVNAADVPEPQPVDSDLAVFESFAAACGVTTR